MQRVRYANNPVVTFEVLEIAEALRIPITQLYGHK